MADRENVKNNVRSDLEEGEANVRKAAETVGKKIKRSQNDVLERVTEIDRQAHENPWPLIAGVGVSCLLLGILLGKSK